MAEDTRLTISDNISGSIATKLKAIGVAARQSHKDVEVLKTALRGLSSSASAFKGATASATTFRTATRSATTAVNALRTANNQTAASFQNLSRQSRTASTSLNAMAHGAGNYSRNALSGSYATHRLVGALAAVAGVRAFATASDDAANMRNQIRLVVESNEELYEVQTRLFDLATETRSDLTATTKLYTRLRQNLAGVITDQEEFWQMTETLNKAVLATGRTTGEATASILQFTQAMAKGKLDGDEFRSLLENLPILGKALEKQLGVTRGELYELAPAGKITFDVIREAVKLMAADVEIAFANTEMTIGQALTNLNTKFIQFMNSNSAASQIVIFAINAIGNSLDIVIPLVVAFGAAWVTVQLVQVAADMFHLGRALIAFAPAILGAVIATANFTLGLMAGVAALYAIGAAVAIATGNYEEFNAWVVDAGTQVAKFVQSITGLGTGVGEASGEFLKLDKAATDTGNSFAEAGKRVEELGKATEVTGAVGEESFQGVVRQVERYGNTLDDLLAKLRRVNAEQARMGGGGSTRSDGFEGTSFIRVGDAPKVGSDDSSIIGSYASGGSFKVKGKSGVDKNLARFRVSRGERVDILTRAQQRAQGAASSGSGPKTFNIELVFPNADIDSFRRSRRQLSNDIMSITSAV